nr:23S rRNA (adenine(2030)-N(6))-methyltransferase RlmJ [Propylenella binzhouense]
MKHVVLARILEHLKAKPAPFRVLDLHAGTGFYDLAAAAAARTEEWTEGVGRLYAEGTMRPVALAPAVEALLLPWRQAIASANDGARLLHYPGSPEIARRLTRSQDRLILNELHPEDHGTLAARYAADRRIRVTGQDAWVAARANLPPPERRGIVIADPAYEASDETAKLLSGLAESHRRFATGIVFAWYPVKAQADANALARRVAALGLPKTIRIELTVRRADGKLRMNGSGIFVVNPPWRLEAELRQILPALQARLADAEARFPGGWRLEPLTGER